MDGSRRKFEEYRFHENMQSVAGDENDAIQKCFAFNWMDSNLHPLFCYLITLYMILILVCYQVADCEMR